MRREQDPMLRRFERNLLLTCLAMTAGAALLGRLDVAAGVLGGGLIAAIGYGAIKGAVDMLVAGVLPRDGRPRARMSGRQRAWITLKFLGRYALLALAAYAMLSFLRMHPVGLLLGASAPVLSAVVELVWTGRAAAHPRHTR